MLKKLFSVLFLYWVALSATQAQVPELVDLTLVGSKDDAYFEPNQIELIEGQTYILVIHNPFELTYLFDAPTLAGAIVTQYIQGSASVTQRSVQISPESKVQWIFTVTKAGKHYYKAVLAQGHSSLQRKPGMIHIIAKNGKPEPQEPSATLQLPEGGYKTALKSEQVDYEPEQSKSRRLMPERKRGLPGRAD